MSSPDNRRLTTFVVVMAVLIAAPLAVVASDAFTDVPDSNVHHDDVTWLADNGVTAGCNPPANTEYCPGEPVLRQQMASFMRRLAENEVVNAATAREADHAATADDADMLDGQDSTAYSTVISAASCSINAAADATSCGPNPDGSVPDETTIELLAVNIDVPAAGTVMVSAQTRSSTTNWVTLDEACTPYSPDPTAIFAQILNGIFTVGTDAGTTATDVAAGQHTLRLCSVYEDTDGAGAIQVANLVAMWTPGGSVEIQSAPSGEGTPLDTRALNG